MNMTLEQAINALSDPQYQTIDGLRALVNQVSVQVPNAINGAQTLLENNSMAFVIEKIPQEQLTTSSQKLIGFNPKLCSRWAIDRDRDAFIIVNRTEGGAYEGTQATEYYTLSWKNELIRIVAEPLPSTYIEQGAVMSWRIRHLAIPETLQYQKEEVFQLIKDAFTAVGDCFNGHEYFAVNVEFKPLLLN
ncbi:MAG: hypothetical protein ACXV8O_16705 [Methylobacter sp.]